MPVLIMNLVNTDFVNDFPRSVLENSSLHSFSDVCLQAGTGRDRHLHHVHKALLAAFSTLLRQLLQDVNYERDICIHFADVSCDVVQRFVQLLYDGSSGNIDGWQQTHELCCLLKSLGISSREYIVTAVLSDEDIHPPHGANSQHSGALIQPSYQQNVQTSCDNSTPGSQQFSATSQPSAQSNPPPSVSSVQSSSDARQLKVKPASSHAFLTANNGRSATVFTHTQTVGNEVCEHVNETMFAAVSRDITTLSNVSTSPRMSMQCSFSNELTQNSAGLTPNSTSEETVHSDVQQSSVYNNSAYNSSFTLEITQPHASSRRQNVTADAQHNGEKSETSSDAEHNGEKSNVVAVNREIEVIELSDSDDDCKPPTAQINSREWTCSEEIPQVNSKDCTCSEELLNSQPLTHHSASQSQSSHHNNSQSQSAHHNDSQSQSARPELTNYPAVSSSLVSVGMSTDETDSTITNVPTSQSNVSQLISPTLNSAARDSISPTCSNNCTGQIVPANSNNNRVTITDVVIVNVPTTSQNNVAQLTSPPSSSVARDLISPTCSSDNTGPKSTDSNNNNFTDLSPFCTNVELEASGVSLNGDPMQLSPAELQHPIYISIQDEPASDHSATARCTESSSATEQTSQTEAALTNEIQQQCFMSDYSSDDMSSLSAHLLTHTTQSNNNGDRETVDRDAYRDQPNMSGKNDLSNKSTSSNADRDQLKLNGQRDLGSKAIFECEQLHSRRQKPAESAQKSNGDVVGAIQSHGSIENVSEHNQHKAAAYGCNRCPKAFPGIAELKSHLLNTAHSSNVVRPFKCTLCGQIRRKVCDLDHHVRKKHLKQTRFSCNACPLKFFYNSELQCHRKSSKCAGRSASRMKIASAILKGDKKSSAEEVISHEQQQGSSKCDGGGKYHFLGHLEAESKPKALKYFKSLSETDHPAGDSICCRICTELFSSIKSMKAHLQATHLNRRYKCKFCGVYFAPGGNRVEHELTVHRTEIEKMGGVANWRKKNNTVSLCEMSSEIGAKTLVESGGLQSEMKYAFGCSFCSEVFSNVAELKSHHSGTHHQDVDDRKPFRCNVCLACFLNSSHLDWGFPSYFRLRRRIRPQKSCIRRILVCQRLACASASDKS